MNDKNDVRVLEKPPERVNVLNYVRLALVLLLVIASSSATSVNYINYGNRSNITGFGSAFDYAKNSMATATGWSDTFGVMVLAMCFFGVYIVGSKYTQERALGYTMFFTMVIAYLLVSGNFLDPKWLILSIVGLLAAIYFSSRTGS